jgi:fucose permease
MLHLLLAVIYLSFISLGLPDGLLGAAWPTVYPEFGVPVSASGILFITVSVGTVISSLLSDRLTRRFGPGLVTAVSTALTAAALFGFAASDSFWMLWLWAIPYGLGAGGVDAALNNYVALHYESRHMSWLHAMWGVGAAVGPYIMSAVLTAGSTWNMGYLTIGIIQTVLVAALFLSLPLWKGGSHEDAAVSKPLTFRQIFAIPSARELLIAFFCYIALEQTAALWASSYLVLDRGMDTTAAAGFAGLFYLGITAGRFINGFLSMKLSDSALIRLGLAITAVGVVLLLIPSSVLPALAGLLILGLGCAPIYPCIIHSTPAHFGADNSQALIGVQMASAYIGCVLMPPLFGLVADHLGIFLYPAYLLAFLILMTWMHEQVLRKTAH